MATQLGILAYITACVAVANFRSKQARHVSFFFSLLFRTKIIMSDASNQHRPSSSSQTQTDGFLMIQQMTQTPPRGAYTSLMRCNDKQIVQNTMESSSDVSIWLKRASHMTTNHLVSK
ncbi:hypothetical protein QC762_0060670 [Podospora pseudocomata]|uniref:Uncharacterized protein n=1 Tax=Podospora pseudocomata TaxID=2093779 RepID=A0ABR0GL25_9PEZI|nr:hypothetical protein QC762_0060670 [Podospora pseudocomata]